MPMRSGQDTEEYVGNDFDVNGPKDRRIGYSTEEQEPVPDELRLLRILVDMLDPLTLIFFFFNDTATTEIYTLSLHDALPISRRAHPALGRGERVGKAGAAAAHTHGARGARARLRQAGTGDGHPRGPVSPRLDRRVREAPCDGSARALRGAAAGAGKGARALAFRRVPGPRDGGFCGGLDRAGAPRHTAGRHPRGPQGAAPRRARQDRGRSAPAAARGRDGRVGDAGG